MSFDWSGLGAREIENENNSSESFDWSGLEAKKIGVPSRKVHSPRNKKEELEGIKEFGNQALRQVAKGARNVVAGAGDILDLPIGVVNYGLGKVGLGSEDPYIGNMLAKGIDYVTGGYTAPETPNERIAEATTRALSSIPSGYGVGVKLVGQAGKMLPKAGKFLAGMNPLSASNIGATGTGALAGQAYRESNPEDMLGSLGAGLGSDIAMRSALGLANRRNIASALKINPKNVESFYEMGVSPTLGQASNSKFIKGYENILKNTGLSGKIGKLESEQYKKMHDILGPGAHNMAQTELVTGQKLKRSMGEYNKRARGITSRLKEDFLKKAEKAPTDLVDVTDSLFSVDKLQSTLKTRAAQEDFLKSPVGKEYLSLSKRAAENKGGVPLADVLEFRTKLYDEISKRDLGNVSTGRLQQLSQALNHDVKDYMEGIGASKEWNRFNKFYSQFAEKRKPHLVKAKEIAESEANHIFDSIGSTGKINRPLLETAYASQKRPEQIETMNSLIQKMGKRGDEFDTHLFARRFSKEPIETQETILKPLSKEQRKKVRAIFDSIKTVKAVSQEGNPSRTAYTASLMGLGSLGTGLGYAAYKGDLSDSQQNALLTAIASAAVASKAFGNPRFVNWMYNFSKLKTPKGRMHQIKGLKGVLGRPAYQQVKNAIGGISREKHEE